MATPRRRLSDSPDPEAVAAYRAAIEAGEAAPLPPLVPQSLAHGPPLPKPRVKRKPAARRETAPKPAREPVTRKHGSGHPRTNPEAEQAVIAALKAGENAKTAAAAGGVAYPAPIVRNIWERNGFTWPPPGLHKGSGKGGGRPATVTPAQARDAIKLRGKRTPGGGWERSIPAVAVELGVPESALRRAIKKEEKRSKEERG